ncbi:MAG TPA: asparagine synthase (glutamine-hydrolyzing), partial [Phycisphaeraceae bacterium]|nr:asparagine synthase (glutamine-hydrolyzing) [Phycisphaeraceae bacterium]
MCGLACILRIDGTAIPTDWQDDVDAALRHRGPDGCGVQILPVATADGRGEIMLLHRRLSVIDPPGGVQPMSTAEGDINVVFNGCIYNHRELRRELIRSGHHFHTDHSDTEVLLHGWRGWGEDLPQHLEGMFAFVIADRGRELIFAARDRAGEKPLYMLRTEYIFAFASERSALRVISRKAAAGLNGKNAARSLRGYLRKGYIGEDAWLDGSVAVKPGERISITYNGGHIEIERGVYWQPPNRAKGKGKSREITVSAAMAEVERLLQEAVAARLEADVPLGCFLSGGVDSSLIAAFARRQLPGLRTFCVKMNDPRYDESAYAEQAAQHINVSLDLLDVQMKPAEDLVKLIKLTGEPFADSSILPTYWVSRAAREHVTVVLSGDGGDELFLGYDRHIALQALQRYRGILRLLPANTWQGKHPKSLRNRLHRLALAAREESLINSYNAIVNIFDEARLRALVPGGDGNTEERDIPGGAEGAVYSDFTENLPGDLLKKVDAASMACALEVRCPFLDRKLTEYALSLPLKTLTPGLKRKGLLRALARKSLPRETVDRPKMGFALPLGEWF